MDARRPTPDCDAEIARSRGVEIAGERRKTGGKAARLTRLKKTGEFLAVSCAVHFLLDE